MKTYQTSGNAQIYQIPVHEFPGLVGNVYLVIADNYHVLIDTGSGFGESNQDLDRGLDEVCTQRGEDCSLSQLSHIFITHGHIDHYGGLNHVSGKTDAKICIHELDRMIVSNHPERLTLASHRLEEFLTEAGVEEELKKNQLEMYKITKSLFHSVKVDITYEAVGMKIGPFTFYHVPGHCAGHVLIKLHDVVFCGDHVLEKTSPHQSPEQITLSTGLETYLQSLEAMRPLSKKAKIFLGGHENPIKNINQRIDEIRMLHFDRLQKILNFLTESHTIAEISKYLFGKVEGYTILLALEEAGAHVEYLYQRGYLEITNLTDIEGRSNSVPLLYKCVDCKLTQI